MDNSGFTDRLSEMDESDLSSMLQMEMMPMDLACEDVLKSSVMGDLNQTGDDDFDHTKLDLDSCYDMSPYWLDMFDDPVLNDKMMTEASTNPVFKSEHSYSIGKTSAPAEDKMTGTGELAGSFLKNECVTRPRHVTLDEISTPTIYSKFLEVDSLGSRSTSSGAQNRPRSIQTVTVTKQEPRIIVKNEPIIIEARRPPQQQSLLKPSSILLTKTIQPRTDFTSTTVTTLNAQRYEMMTTQQMSDDMDEGIYLNVMPLTPPGSSSDSDGSTSPRQSPTPSPMRQVVFKSSHREINPATAIYSQPIPTSGILVLTEEEKRTLVSEGYPIPTKLPLSKIEEKNLKKVRRKIKNKISAQESRRKRKEYMDHLEKKMEDISQENSDLRSKCDKFEKSNQSLMAQLTKLQNIIKKLTPQQSAAQTGICLMVLVLCFAVFFGDWLPSSLTFASTDSDSLMYSHSSLNNIDTYTSSSMKPSRTLLVMNDEEKSCGNEPWPLFLARKSFEGIVNYINPRDVDEIGGTWGNTSEMPFIVSAAAQHTGPLDA